MINDELIKAFNIEMESFYKQYAEMEYLGLQGPDINESFDWNCWFFCLEHDISYSKFRNIIKPIAEKCIQENINKMRQE